MKSYQPVGTGCLRSLWEGGKGGSSWREADDREEGYHLLTVARRQLSRGKAQRLWPWHLGDEDAVAS